MKNILKKITIVLSMTLLLTTVNCFAYTEESSITNENNLIKTYTVNKDEEQDFLSQIQKEYSDEEYNYKLEKQDKSGGDYTESKDIITTKTITLKTNSTQKILKEFPETIEYSENDFNGEYVIDTDSLKVVTNYNGYTEYLVEDNKEYPNLSRNDLDFIPKEILKNGIKLDLLKVDWELQSTKMVGDYEVADKYIAKCYYAGKIRKDNPYTYTVTATYKGIATKTIENPYQYTLIYSFEKIPNNNLLYIIGGSSIGIIAIFFIVRKNAKVYNLNNGEYKFVGRIYIRKDKIKLSRFAPFEKTNKYKIIIADRKVKKLENKMITIVKGKNTVSKLVNSNNNIKPYTIEVRI
ncbi:MAG: hypothetical protein IJ966_03070 [Bacilli bacterium]|nr:hypothetical protein [Bacilli bacterium]